ncbi:transposase IS3/IS911 family protein (plasmid) [Burkholderia gladioli BSR3]|uniref:Transposase IS3/IS911 family protein n=4 Tax=Burkholderia gladioli TaxID=28095 RepID=F2LTD0_BURGS|nr:transposase IS3/IS911 family protein [Burkholderia gladioli BSR3]
MYTMNGNEAEELEQIEPTHRRRHSREFKEKVVRAAMQPNVSIAAVALHYRLNANLVRRWVVAQQKQGMIEPPAVEALDVPQAAFMPLQLGAACAPVGESEIRIEVRRGAATLTVHWPLSAAGECAAWLRDWLR